MQMHLSCSSHPFISFHFYKNGNENVAKLLEIKTAENRLLWVAIEATNWRVMNIVVKRAFKVKSQFVNLYNRS